MALTYTNLATGETPVADANGIVDFVIQAVNAEPNVGGGVNNGSRLISIVSSNALPTTYTPTGGSPTVLNPGISATVIGDCSPTISAVAVYANLLTTPTFHAEAQLIITPPSAPGIYSLSGVITDNEQTQPFLFRIRVLPGFNPPLWTPCAFVPPGSADLQFILDTLTCNSAVLSRQLGLTQGDNFSLAIVASQSGAFIGTGVTGIKLTITPAPGYGDSALIFSATGTPLAPVNPSGSNFYYALTGQLNSSILQSWFSLANAPYNAAVKAARAANTALPVNPAQILQCQATLSLTNAAGTFSSQPFPFPINQTLANTN